MIPAPGGRGREPVVDELPTFRTPIFLFGPISQLSLVFCYRYDGTAFSAILRKSFVVSDLTPFTPRFSASGKSNN